MQFHLYLGVKREEGDTSGNFPIFENVSNMYSTFNFTYAKGFDCNFYFSTQTTQY